MADEIENDDQWLYGDAPDIPTIANSSPLASPSEEEPLAPPGEDDSLLPPIDRKTPEETDPPAQVDELESEPVTDTQFAPQSHLESSDPPPPGAEDDHEADMEKQNGDGSDKDDSDDDSDDDVNVVIGDIKTSPAYTSLNIKRGGLLTSTATDKSKQPQQQPGKFTVEEFDTMGMINGVPAAEYNLDSLEDKPWRKPGADITDYFNYGFNEDTWKAYCERQKRLRMNESGVGLLPLNSIGLPRGPIPIMNDNSKYSGAALGLRKAGPPPGRRMTGAIDVIGGAPPSGARLDAPKENVIQVMTADRREYSRKPPGFPDLSMPPPSAFEEFQPEFGFNPEPEPFYGGYEPTQDLQWVAGPGIVPAPVPPVNLAPPMVPPILTGKEGTPPVRPRSRDRDRERERDRDREREISRSRSEKPRDRDRERSHRRERSRSRSRRHKSRSRSPSHRHRKKKSRRHEDSD